jgi:DNA repair protein
MEVKPELSAEQLAKIEQNKRKAQERLEQRKALESLQAAIMEEPNDTATAHMLNKSMPSCQYINLDGSKCSSMTIDAEIWEAFGEAICGSCKRGSSGFDLITQKECASCYLIAQDTLKWVKHCTRNNPRKPGWKPMKLYLRREAEKLAIERFGSMDALEQEKKVREEKKFERGLAKTKDILAISSDQYRNQSQHPSLLAPEDKYSHPPAKKQKKKESNVEFFKNLGQSILKAEER